MLACHVLDELVLPIVPDGALFADIRFVVSMSPFMVLAVSNRGESFRAMKALVRFLSRVSTHVDQQVALLGKYLATALDLALEEVVSRVR